MFCRWKARQPTRKLIWELTSSASPKLSSVQPYIAVSAGVCRPNNGTTTTVMGSVNMRKRKAASPMASLIITV